MARTLLFLYAESPVHAGADSSAGAVDLPMQRDGHTGLPVIWGQSLKGALRTHAFPLWGSEPDAVKAFGAAPPKSGDGGGDLTPGTLSIGDAELVAFPVPTLVETYAWVTSQLTLARLERKAALADVETAAGRLAKPDSNVALVAHTRWTGERVVLGPYVVNGRQDPAVSAWAGWLARTGLPGERQPAERDIHLVFRTKLAADLVLVAEPLLARCTVECAEVTPRVQLKVGVKTVEHGPFYTEYLPTESLLAAVVEGSAEHLARLRQLLDGEVLRVGGDETIGKGLMWCRFAGAVTS